MRVEVTMPQLGESIAEGTIIKWHKKVGDFVRKDETILEISTDKVDSEIPSPAEGRLTEILAEEGQTVPVGAVLAYIETAAETQTAVEKTPEAPAKAAAVSQAEPGDGRPVVKEKVVQTGREGRQFLSPLVRKMAAEYGISMDELLQIPGSGHLGRITKEDLLRYVEQKKQQVPGVAPPPVSPERPSVETGPAEIKVPPGPEPVRADDRVEIIQMDHIRKAIAEHMVRSVHTAPHVATFAEVDMTRIVNIRERIKNEFERKEGFKLTYTAFFVDAAARALKEFPYLNASVDGDKIILKKYINIGVAVAVGQNLIVPVIKNADQKNLLGIARAIHELTEKARSKRLLPDDVQDGTFTITNPGIFGNTVGIAIINQPQVAILDTGAIKKRPVVVNDAIAIRPIMWMSLSYDHRIIDGAMAAQFVQRIVQILENYEDIQL